MTRSIQVEARGEVAELKDNINTMIDNLRLTTDHNTEQDWLSVQYGKQNFKTGPRIVLQGMRPIEEPQKG